MSCAESAVGFACHDAQLCGILSLPRQPVSRGVLIVVGGPQYRAGSHRQFTLLARFLAARGIPVFRFDYRGMGDSGGDARSFEDVGDDLRTAIDKFSETMPGLAEVVIWGLCDAASAALFYAHQDRRVTGLVLLNPWVRTEQGIAKTYLKHYYRSRFFERALWDKVLRGRFDWLAAARSFSALVREGFGRQRGTMGAACDAPLPQRMLDGFRRFDGRVLLILSGNDLTAKEFLELADGSRDWQGLLKSRRVQRHDLPLANHTFARREWRDQVAAWTHDWMKTW
ncbi:hydrolase 1, exosortase A system-associated [Noviherbaspirillum cavernae]|uniref:Hydrolase 1, exosortase A system-associated n=1 Tax=Noviherbaspirillum cavernae TaxID=2320862 RepID=A0A418X3R6_9BURK|nr:hydrolase 1, exosortase A system-associated [Noviherbaspirillum cavernae]RJG07065.1 hydrolase 1, exosortase A system-associated [Noviherbaspirillum cavernae]